MIMFHQEDTKQTLILVKNLNSVLKKKLKNIVICGNNQENIQGEIKIKLWLVGLYIF